MKSKQFVVILLTVMYMKLEIMISHPYDIAPAKHNPMAADFPLPLPAVSDTVERKVCSEIASRKDNTAFA